MITQDEVEQFVRNLSSMASARMPYESDWRDCFDHSFPERGAGLAGSVAGTAPSDGRVKRARLMDNTSRVAMRTFCSAMQSAITPANGDWFDLDAGMENDSEKAWLSDAAATVLENIRASNHASESMDAMFDGAAAGWFVLYIDEGEEGGYEFETWPIAECFIGQSRKAGPVDILYRRYTCTVDQVVTEFGLQHVSEDTRKRWEDNKRDYPVELCRVIEPRRNSNGVLAKTMPFRSVTFEVAQKHQLHEGGYHEFPCCVPRFTRLPGSVYAVGSMLDVLADTKTLNDLAWTEYAHAELAIAPPLKAKADGILNPKTIRWGPRVVIPMADTDNLQEIQSGARFDISWTQKGELRTQIRTALMADQLEPQDKANMTAYEVSVRQAQMRQLLAPMFGRFQSEYVKPLVERCFAIAYRAGALGQAPESLAARIYTVRYRNPFARAEQLEEVEAIDASLRATAELSAAMGGSQDPWDVIDVDGAQRAIYEGRGIRQKLIRSPDDIQARRDQRAQQNQAAQQQAMQNEAAIKTIDKGVTT